MGRNAKTPYPRTATVKFRISPEHEVLVKQVRDIFPNLSQADVFIYALEEYAARHCKGRIKSIPCSQVKKNNGKTGKEIIIGKNY
jgi:hypothetical protein